ncbi:hypothetical protein MLD38_039508 [Melastoma candidum]|uniref:Uncharacterized protein n=1 Tax=Melastoma candidum TaxID=119954 RepID=A0ACB9L3E2_9MYRT|nr:hypothetical protein MLD38_039508 [Melastoma candidum]
MSTSTVHLIRVINVHICDPQSCSSEEGGVCRWAVKYHHNRGGENNPTQHVREETDGHFSSNGYNLTIRKEDRSIMGLQIYCPLPIYTWVVSEERTKIKKEEGPHPARHHVGDQKTPKMRNFWWIKKGKGNKGQINLAKGCRVKKSNIYIMLVFYQRVALVESGTVKVAHADVCR